jgi:Mor family transcriptional regulator
MKHIKKQSPPITKITNLTAKAGHMIKPIDMVEMKGLGGWGLVHWKTWHTLLHHAWSPELDNPTAEFTMPIKEVMPAEGLRRELEKVLRVLQTTLATARIGGEDITVQVLGHSSFKANDYSEGSSFKYSYHHKFVEALRKTDLYAQLELKVMNAFTSKYSAFLYELVAKRAGLSFKSQEEISVEDLRDWLHVPVGKLNVWYDLERRAIIPAVKEVNELSPYSVTVDPIKCGNKVTVVKLSWSKKLPMSQGEQEAVKEVNRPKFGRKARLAGAVETVIPDLQEYVLTNQLAAIIKKENPDRKPKEIWDEFILPELTIANPKNVKPAVLHLAKRYAGRK